MPPQPVAIPPPPPQPVVQEAPPQPAVPVAQPAPVSPLPEPPSAQQTYPAPVPEQRITEKAEEPPPAKPVSQPAQPSPVPKPAHTPHEQTHAHSAEQHKAAIPAAAVAAVVKEKKAEPQNAHTPVKPATVKPAPFVIPTVVQPVAKPTPVQVAPHHDRTQPKQSTLSGLDSSAKRALTSSGAGSIRERATSAILSIGRPLSLDEVLDKLKTDGQPLPPHNPKEILKTVLNNKNLFRLTDSKYMPIAD